MKKYIFKTVLIALVAMVASCTQNNDFEEVNDEGIDKSQYVYTLHLNDGAPIYSDDMTRATTTWKTGSEVSLRLKSGSSIITGTAQYDGKNWTLTTSQKISTTTNAAECGALYYENATGLTDFTPSSIVYMGEGSYTASSTDIYVTVTLKPVTWRLRFKGTSGTNITLKGDIDYLKSMSVSSGKLVWEKQTEQQAVELKVNSNGYTDYIYGDFAYKYYKNTLTIVNETEGITYERTDIDGNMLAAGSSGYLTIPTSSNYSSLGWKKIETIDQNATVTPVILTPLYNNVVWKYECGNTADYFYEKIYENLSGFKDDNEIIEDIVKNVTSEKVDNKTETYVCWWDINLLKANTQYYMCTIAYNKDGERGPLQKVPFTTKSESEPRAIISNLVASTYSGNNLWEFDVKFVNGAKKYYIKYWEYSSYYNEDDALLVYFAYKDIKNGQFDTYDYTSASFNRTDKQCVVVLVAVDSKGNICGYSIDRATTERSSVQGKSNKSRKDATSTRIPEMIMRAKTTDMKFEPMLTPNINVLNKR